MVSVGVQVAQSLQQPHVIGLSLAAVTTIVIVDCLRAQANRGEMSGATQSSEADQMVGVIANGQPLDTLHGNDGIEVIFPICSHIQLAEVLHSTDGCY